MEFLNPTLKKSQYVKNDSQQKTDMQNYQAGKESNKDVINAYLTNTCTVLQVPTRILKDVNFNTFLGSGDFWRLLLSWKPLQTIWTQIRTDRTSVLIWVQTVWHSYEKVLFEKNPEMTTKAWNIT